MRYLSTSQIILLHALVVEITGGLPGIREPHVLASLERSPRQRVFGQMVYPTIWRQAAVYIRDLISLHPFVDGNKRTGILAALTFLERNGYESSAATRDLQRFALAVARQKWSLERIARWLQLHSRKC